MQCAESSIAIFGFCLSQSSAVLAALCTGIFSLSSTFWKIASDHYLRKKNAADKKKADEERKKFEVDEREARHQFQIQETKNREKFETEEARRREASAEQSAIRIQTAVQEFIKLEKWREESWQRNLDRVDSANQLISKICKGLTMLVDEGPVYSDFRMIQETAGVLDIFGDFQTVVGHFALPPRIVDVAERFIKHSTRLLLTLSPIQSVRSSEQRKRDLAPLKLEMNEIQAEFKRLCAEFEQDPNRFLLKENA